jgi:environmental stress-induced protein Ves
MRIMRAASYRRMPWKNGGGETTEIAVWPQDAGLDDFGWRVSMARVERDGPFSAFPGVDRTLSIIEGVGLRLAVAGRPAAELDGKAEPFVFPADQPTDSTLLGGPVTDLNVMTGRGRFTHRVRRIGISGKAEIVSDADTAILLCRSGSVAVTAAGRTGRLGPLDSLMLDGSHTTVEAEAGRTAMLFLIEIVQAA